VRIIQRLVIALILLAPVMLGIFILLSPGFDKDRGIAGGFKKIGLVRIEGVISESYSIVKQLRSFRFDNSIAGILIRVDSPGGSVAPSQEIYSEISKIEKPVIVSMGNLAASGGYYVSSPARRIFADPGTLTGSIGVIFSLPLVEELSKKIGIEMRILTAGKYKDLTSIYREMSDGERKILQSLLDDTHDQFISDVAKARKMSKDSVSAIADGRIFTGRQAIEVGLVDTLGGFEEALDYLRETSGLSRKAKVVERRERITAFRKWIVEEIADIFPQLQSLLSPPGPQYLFYPGS
jgi:protease-4